MPRSVKATDVIATHQLLMDRIDALSQKCPYSDPRFYAPWVSQFYYFVVHATRMLAAAASRMDVSQDELHFHFLNHAQEEKNHDKLVLKDLEALGHTIEEFPELPLTAQLYQSQYYFATYKHPLSIMGGILYMEGLSLKIGPEILKVCKEAHGESACQFVIEHAEADQEHLREAFQVLHQVPPLCLEQIHWSMQQMAAIYEAVIQQQLEHYSARQRLKAS